MLNADYMSKHFYKIKILLFFEKSKRKGNLKKKNINGCPGLHNTYIGLSKTKKHACK